MLRELRLRVSLRSNQPQTRNFDIQAVVRSQNVARTARDVILAVNRGVRQSVTVVR